MRAVPIPNDEIPTGAIRKPIMAPPGTEDFCGAVDAAIDGESPFGGRRFMMRVELEPGDLERLQSDPHFWLVLHVEQLVPFGFAFTEEAT